MIDFLDRLSGAHGGVLAMAGLLLAVASLVVAVYFYYNPRQSSYRISYKVFRPSQFSWNPRSADTKNSIYFIDIWNSGKDTISHEIIRERIAIALQPSPRRDVNIVEISIDKETHPSISKFDIRVDGDIGILNWSHFDPKMGLRVKLIINDLLSADRIVCYGGGLRLNIERIRQISERGSGVNNIKAFLVIGVPIAILTVISGTIITYIPPIHISGILAYVVGAGALLATAAFFVGAAFVAFGIDQGVDRLFNGRSPIERDSGAPNTQFMDFNFKSFSGGEHAVGSLLGSELSLVAESDTQEQPSLERN